MNTIDGIRFRRHIRNQFRCEKGLRAARGTQDLTDMTRGMNIDGIPRDLQRMRVPGPGSCIHIRSVRMTAVIMVMPAGMFLLTVNVSMNMIRCMM
jgi:hypothetical protein